MKIYEEIIYKKTEEAIRNKYGESFDDLDIFSKMSIIKAIIDQLYMVYEDVEEKDIRTSRKVTYINGYEATREYINNKWTTYNMFGGPDIETGLLITITRHILEEIKAITGRKREKDIFLIFLCLKKDKNIKVEGLNNMEIVKKFTGDE